jgi:hypothetical protein
VAVVGGGRCVPDIPAIGQRHGDHRDAARQRDRPPRHHGRQNAILQLLAPTTGHHVLSIFLRAGETRIVPVPPGTGVCA